MFDTDKIWQLLTHPGVFSVFAIVFATLVLNYVARRLLLLLEHKAELTTTLWDDVLARSARRPLAWSIWVLGVSWAAEVIAAETDSTLAQLIAPARYIAFAGLLTLCLGRFTSEMERKFILDGADVTTATAIGKLLRVSVIITATLSVLQTLGFSISGVLAFGGVGGIAVGFAARDLLANFFGGLMIHLDRPFAIGDWVRSPDRELEGTVETIGWRLTVIRTFDQRPLYVPNSVFNTVALENPSRMNNRRIYETIGLRYDDLDKLAAIVAEVRAMLASHPDIDPTRTLIVNFNTFADSALEFFVYTFTNTTDWVEFHQVKQKILLQIAQIIATHQAKIAYPTLTVDGVNSG